MFHQLMLCVISRGGSCLLPLFCSIWFPLLMFWGCWVFFFLSQHPLRQRSNLLFHEQDGEREKSVLVNPTWTVMWFTGSPLLCCVTRKLPDKASQFSDCRQQGNHGSCLCMLCVCVCCLFVLIHSLPRTKNLPSLGGRALRGAAK